MRVWRGHIQRSSHPGELISPALLSDEAKHPFCSNPMVLGVDIHRLKQVNLVKSEFDAVLQDFIPPTVAGVPVKLPCVIESGW